MVLICNAPPRNTRDLASTMEDVAGLKSGMIQWTWTGGLVKEVVLWLLWGHVRLPNSGYGINEINTNKQRHGAVHVEDRAFCAARTGQEMTTPITGKPIAGGMFKAKRGTNSSCQRKFLNHVLSKAWPEKSGMIQWTWTGGLVKEVVLWLLWGHVRLPNSGYGSEKGNKLLLPTQILKPFSVLRAFKGPEERQFFCQLQTPLSNVVNALFFFQKSEEPRTVKARSPKVQKRSLLDTSTLAGFALEHV